jgi:predicted RNA-binding protein with PUA-like domain
MSFVDNIIHNRLEEAKKLIFERLDELATEKWEDAKAYLANDMFEEVEVSEEEYLEEASKRNPNIVKMGRITKVRRRIRRNTKGRIVVQKNVRKSGLKGYRISGSTVKRIPAYVRIHKARMLKRSWKTKRKAKLRRTLFKRRMSMRRRQSMGLR